MDTKVDDILSQYRGWLLKTAWEYADNVADVQDLAQEGHIAMWKHLETWREDSGVKLSTHLMNKARWRMAEVRQRGTYTGKPSQAGKKHSAGTGANRGKEQATDFGVSDFEVVSVTKEEVEAIMVAYHRGEIMAALNMLKPQHREKVLDWFWRGIVDSKNRAWWDGKGYGAKYKLREQLEHLKELVV